MVIVVLSINFIKIPFFSLEFFSDDSLETHHRFLSGLLKTQKMKARSKILQNVSSKSFLTLLNFQSLYSQHQSSEIRMVLGTQSIQLVKK